MTLKTSKQMNIITLVKQQRRNEITLDQFRRSLLILLATDDSTINIAIDVGDLLINQHMD